ncbi:MAG: hypothetical protein GEU26_15400 [Nitrososphaeraceae archaeon]|nr:hypothetical protein [Nitrososphaeraceae archaeon]
MRYCWPPLAIHIHKRLFCPLNNCEFTFNDVLKRGLNVEEKGGDNKTYDVGTNLNVKKTLEQGSNVTDFITAEQ